VTGNRLLSVVQKSVLLDMVNKAASRGTLLTPRHISELAERLGGKKPGKNWAGNVLKRYRK